MAYEQKKPEKDFHLITAFTKNFADKKWLLKSRESSAIYGILKQKPEYLYLV